MDGLRGAISQGPGLVIFRILVFVLLAYLLYSLYNWLTGESSDFKDYVLYRSPNSGLPGNSNKIMTYDSSNIPGLYPGGEFSVSTWIYVTNWTVNKGKNKMILSLSGGGDQYETMVMYLGQYANKLGIRVSYEDPSSAASSSTSLSSSQINLVKAGSSPYSDASSDFKKCDIEQVNLQKWVNITAVMAGRTLDVYIDGKLSRSCVLDGMYKVDGNSPKLRLGGYTSSDGFGGLIGATRIANFAYSPDQVYKHYLTGPFDTSFFATLMSYFNPSQYSVDIKRNGQNIVSANS
jgi:hypothetical protein